MAHGPLFFCFFFLSFFFALPNVLGIFEYSDGVWICVVFVFCFKNFVFCFKKKKKKKKTSCILSLKSLKGCFI